MRHLSAFVLFLVAPHAVAEQAGRSPHTFIAMMDGKEIACAGLAVHLIPESDRDREITAPCGVAFFPPEGTDRYRLWMEGPGYISHRQWTWNYSSDVTGPSKRGARVSVVRAGSVQLVPLPDPRAFSWRLLTVDSGFARRIAVEHGGEPVQMPPGTVVGAIVDRGGAYLALSKPIKLEAGAVVRLVAAPPPPPAVDLMANLRRPLRGANLEISLRVAGVEMPPAAVGGDGTNYYAFWYGLTARTASIEVKSPDLWLERPEVALTGTGVVSAVLELALRPNLHVSLALPPDLEGERALEIRDRGATVWKKALGDRAEVDAERLPPGKLEVKLVVGGWAFLRTADLGDGKDHTLVFAPPVYRVRGRVFVGDKPVAAKLEFMSGAPHRTVQCTSDAEGKYEITLYADYGTVYVYLDGVDSPYHEIIEERFKPETTLDFRLPANTVRVEVRDAASDEPLVGGSVTYRIVGGKQGNMSYGATRAVREDGSLILGPFGAGTFRLMARAPKHVEESREVEIADGATAPVVFRLKAEGQTNEVAIRLPSGRPASSADLVVLSSPDGVPLWRGSADPSGTAVIPRGVSGWLGIRHAEAASLLVPWAGEPADRQSELRLTERAPTLRVQSVDHTGQPVAGARVRVWLGGIELGAAAQNLLLSVPPGTDYQGVWAAEGLQQVSVEIVCWSRKPQYDPQKGEAAIAAQRLVIPFPWPSIVTLELAR